MAQVVLGIATSHTPQVSSGAEWWEGHAGRDRGTPELLGTDGAMHTFDELEATAPPGLGKELERHVFEEKFARAQTAITTLGQRLAGADPDVLVVVGDDQHELFTEEGIPAIGICTGDELWDRGLTEGYEAEMPADVLPAQWAAHADTAEAYPIARAMSEHLAVCLTENDFDITVFSQQAPSRTLGHAFTFFRRRLGLRHEVPMVTVALNTYFPPNVPSSARCFALGEVLRRGIEAWDGPERVAIAASGGLSHFVVNEELDNRVLDGLAKSDVESLGTIPRQHLLSGNSEILNWIVVGGALAGSPVDLVDYIPAYRSTAGTGVGMGFLTWAPDEA